MMRKILLFFGIFFVMTVTLAQEVEVSQYGKTHLKPDTLIWRPVSELEKIAYQNPGKEIPIIKSIKIERTDFLHQVQIKQYDSVIVFNAHSNSFKTIKKPGTIRGQQEFFIFIVFLFVPIFFLIITNIKLEINKKISTASFIMTCLGIACLMLAVIMAIFSCSNAFIIGICVSFIVFAALFASMYSFKRSATLKWYKIFSIIFYFCACITLVIDFIF